MELSHLKNVLHCAYLKSKTKQILLFGENHAPAEKNHVIDEPRKLFFFQDFVTLANKTKTPVFSFYETYQHFDEALFLTSNIVTREQDKFEVNKNSFLHIARDFCNYNVYNNYTFNPRVNYRCAPIDARLRFLAVFLPTTLILNSAEINTHQKTIDFLNNIDQNLLGHVINTTNARLIERLNDRYSNRGRSLLSEFAYFKISTSLDKFKFALLHFYLFYNVTHGSFEEYSELVYQAADSNKSVLNDLHDLLHLMWYHVFKLFARILKEPRNLIIEFIQKRQVDKFPEKAAAYVENLVEKIALDFYGTDFDLARSFQVIQVKLMITTLVFNRHASKNLFKKPMSKFFLSDLLINSRLEEIILDCIRNSVPTYFNILELEFITAVELLGGVCDNFVFTGGAFHTQKLEHYYQSVSENNEWAVKAANLPYHLEDYKTARLAEEEFGKRLISFKEKFAQELLKEKMTMEF